MPLAALFALLSASAAEYSLCFLGSGPKSGSFDKPSVEALQKQHLDHINRMWKEGPLESAGLVAKLAGKRGIFLFSAPIAEAKKWAEQDPKLVAGDLSVECYRWLGPAGVGKERAKRP